MSNLAEENLMTAPKINVTPLIDVLLVLLIIFMVVAPLKPSSFQAKVPSDPQPIDSRINPNPDALVVSVGRDLSLAVNEFNDLGTPDRPDALTRQLASIFNQRSEQGNVIKVVFVKAPRNVAYGKVVKVIDAIKLAGADPLALQIDRLD
jgi:biopolymer transport protein ExbD